jgi:hypothetical protein
MGSKILGTLAFADWDEPTPTDDWRLMLKEWLEYQRHQHSGQARTTSRPRASVSRGCSNAGWTSRWRSWPSSGPLWWPMS